MSYNLLKGKRGVIFGALNDKSIAWKVAEKAVEEGAIITLSNTPVAVRMGDVSKLGEKLNAEVIPADATNVDDLEMVFEKSMEVLGGKIDFVLHSIGMSPNVRKKRLYDDIDYDLLNKTARYKRPDCKRQQIIELTHHPLKFHPACIGQVTVQLFGPPDQRGHPSADLGITLIPQRQSAEDQRTKIDHNTYKLLVIHLYLLLTIRSWCR